METVSFRLLVLGVVLLSLALGSFLGVFSRPTLCVLPLFILATRRGKWLMILNICFALFGPSLTYGLKSLQFIQELSHVILQLVHNIVGSELREIRCEGLKDNTNLSALINGGPMYLRLVY